MMKKFLIAATALSLTASPVLAQSAAAPPPAAEQVEGSALFDGSPGSVIGPVLFATVVLFGILLATETWPFDEDDDEPVSP